MKYVALIAAFTAMLCSALPALAETQSFVMPISPLHPGALFCVLIFICSYGFVLCEEHINIRKSKPVIMGAGIIWLAIGMLAPHNGASHEHVEAAIMHGLEEYASLLLFLLVAMTYISALQDRGVFDVLRTKLVGMGLTLRQLFWVTGAIAFCLSPIADNLTTTLVVGAIIMAVGKHDTKFVVIACINAVNAANAGGAFSPFGDITTLMVWQAGHVDFFGFFSLFLPSVACFLVPAAIMSLFVPRDLPPPVHQSVTVKRGAILTVVLGLLTIVLAVSADQMLGLPPFMGMMTGLGMLMISSFFIDRLDSRQNGRFDIMALISAAEWDTLLFFFGVIFSVGGLAFLGYMSLASTALYEGWGPDATNIALGIVSAVVDNIPIMFAVLGMNPDLSHFHWLLITLTTGIGGSLLSVGSAAGVAMMGVARGQYTFMAHLKWTPVLALGYGAAIGLHYALNA